MASEADIETLMAFVGSINREQSQALLSRNNYDVEKAINFFYDDPTTALQSITTSWTDPPPYTSINDSEFQSYNIHAPDVKQSGSGHATAPSRPPSRISTHGDIQDLAELHAAADPNDRFTEEEKNNPLIQQERERLNGVGYMGGQTTGVTRSGQNFRKVPNDRSDTDKWIMTTSSAITPDLPPECRRRRPEEPAFLRSPGDDSYLGPLLTIYHAIPLAKEALLFKRFPKRDNDYGIEPLWWNGETVVQVRIIDDDGADNEEVANAYDVVHEAQRLMAFLDGTDRAFGSTAPLSRMACLAGISVDPRDPWSDSDSYRLLQFWRSTLTDSRTIDDPAEFPNVFESKAVKMSLDRPGEPTDTKTFNTIGSPEITTGLGQSLYDELDATIWKDYVGQPLDDVWIDELAEIVTFRFGHDSRSGEGLDIPAVWYPDRYLSDSRMAARRMREQKLSAMREVHGIDESKRRLVTHTVNGEERDVRADLLAAVDAAKITSRVQKESTIEANEGLMNGTARVSLMEAEACIAELEAMLERIDKKAQFLDEQRQVIIESIKQTAHAAAQAANSPDAPHKHRYTLHGVSTHPHITYLLYPANLEQPSGEAQDYQWYRISYSVEDGQEQRKQIAKEAAREAMKTSGTNLQQGWESLKTSEEIPGYTIRKVSEDVVLTAARDESKSVLLVYASEKAMTHESARTTNNLALQHFVETDNRAFADELRGLDPLQTDLSQSFDPLPRTAGTGSSRTLSNNPFSPADGETEPLINSLRDRQESMDQSRASSATLQSGSNSIIRSEDGQASPKRVKGYDDRIPTSLIQESEMDEMIVGSPRRVEMQEKAGTGLLGLGAAGAIAKAAAQSPSPKNDDDMDVSSTHVEFADG